MPQERSLGFSVVDKAETTRDSTREICPVVLSRSPQDYIRRSDDKEQGTENRDVKAMRKKCGEMRGWHGVRRREMGRRDKAWQPPRLSPQPGTCNPHSRNA
ncbi:hypothetical protein B5807_11888 [Epicoccum nigrum]|uniref:Uncharacterized protein n=1 Tax=Epicoccum nigrum TaxID=105696 RepID=A0A1Y2LHU4_EPING|nr:hypothetical protein B5807_11888 [Epicoccum nigrum]